MRKLSKEVVQQEPPLFLSSLIKILKNYTYSWENTDEEIRLKTILKGGMTLKIKASHDTADVF
jgi:hypothetical protein